jgi:hypothetical protein
MDGRKEGRKKERKKEKGLVRRVRADGAVLLVGGVFRGPRVAVPVHLGDSTSEFGLPAAGAQRRSGRRGG